MKNLLHTKFLKVSFLICFYLIGPSLLAQVPPVVKQYTEKFPNAHMVRLKNEAHVEIFLKRDELRVKQEIIEEDLYLDESASQNSRRSVRFSSFFELEDIEAYSFIYDGKEYDEIKVRDFTEKDELGDVFYDDTRSLNFIFPHLETGSKSLLKYSEEIKNPRFLTPFYFQNFSPINQNHFTVTVDEEINIRFLQFNTEDIPLEYSVEEDGDKKIYTWKTTAIKKYDHEHGQPTLKKVLPHIIPVISSYTVDGKEIGMLNNVQDLYAWYYSMVEGLNQQEQDPELVQLVTDLTADKENELEKVRAIYYWVQKNIKYIAFEYALGGFIPREANQVFKNKYGDCKDNSSILQEMLSIAGIEGNLTWIGTRDIPYSYDEVPTPLVDNHMILAYENGGKTYYLDATGRFLPLEFPSSFIQGKEALISNGKDDFEIKRVPVVPAKKNAVIEVSQINIDGEDLSGSAVAEISGYNKSRLFLNLETITEEEKIREFYNEWFQKGSNKFLISDYSEENKYQYDKNFKLSYNFDVAGYTTQISDEIYVNLNLNPLLTSFRTPKDRKHAIEYDYKRFFSHTNILNIPEGYAVTYLPEDFNFSNELITGKITYEVKGDQVFYHHEFEWNSLILSSEDQKIMNKLIEEAENAYKEVIILKKQKIS